MFVNNSITRPAELIADSYGFMGMIDLAKRFAENPLLLPKDLPGLFGEGKLERFGIEDCRVSQIAQTYYLTYTAVSDRG